jgi:hypothetical protein
VKERRVVIGGLPYFGRMLAELLAGEGWAVRYVPSAGLRPRAWVSTASSIRWADLVYLVGGQAERWSRPDWLAHLSSVPIVMHWLGSDVTYALGAASRGRVSKRLISRPTHWAEVDWTAKELEPLGITAERVALTPAELNIAAPPLPREFAVLTYLPETRPAFYGREIVFDIASALPEVKFLVAGNTGALLPAAENVEPLGWVERMAEVYARSSVLLRLPEHDGLSFMVLEALAAGRYAIWNHPFTGVIEARSGEEALAQLRQLLEAHRAGRLAPNLTGRMFVQKTLSPEVVRAEILDRFASIINARGRRQPSTPERRKPATSDSE